MRHIEMLESPQETGWIAGVKSGLVDVPGHDGASANHDTITDGYRKDSRISADANPVTDLRGPPSISIGSGGTTLFKKIVDEHGPMRNETIVSDFDQLANKGVRLNSAPLTDLHTLLNLDEGTNKRLVADGASVKVDWLDDRDVASKLDTNYAGYTQIGLNHSSFMSIRRASLPYIVHLIH